VCILFSMAVELVCEWKTEGVFNLFGIVEVELKIVSMFTGSMIDKITNKSLTYRLASAKLDCECCSSSEHQTDTFECSIGTFVKMECLLESTWWYNHPKTVPKFVTVPKLKRAEAALGNALIPVAVIIWSLGSMSLGYWTYFV
jgi:hypothetical protein